MPRAMVSCVSEQVSDQAMHLVWAQGYGDPSIDTLWAEMGPSRAVMFGAFGRNAHLVAAHLARFRRLHSDHLLIPLQAKDAGLPALRALFLFARE